MKCLPSTDQINLLMYTLSQKKGYRQTLFSRSMETSKPDFDGSYFIINSKLEFYKIKLSFNFIFHSDYFKGEILIWK